MRSDDFVTFIVGVLLGACIGLSGGAVIHSGIMVSIRSEAVDRGYAEWVVDNRGQAKWQWKEATHATPRQ